MIGRKRESERERETDRESVEEKSEIERKEAHTEDYVTIQSWLKASLLL